MKSEIIIKRKIDKVVEWVSVVVKDSAGNLFFVLEKEKKAWKKPGQWSVMMETIEKKDKTLEDVIRRWLQEELWIEANNWEKICSKDLTLDVYVKDSKKNKIYLVKLYVWEVVLTEKQSEIAQKFTNWEIGRVKLVKLEEFLNCEIKPLRPGTAESILWLKDTFYIQDWEYFRF